MEDTQPHTQPGLAHAQPPTAPKAGGCTVGAKPCGAKCRHGGPCPNPAMPNGRCRMHGGPTPRGLASASLKHGRRSKYLPPLVADAYNAALASEHAKTLTDEIALIDARITELSGQLQTGERGTVWDDLQAVVADIEAGADSQDALQQLQAITAKGKATTQAWRDLDAAVLTKAKLVAAESKRSADQREGATAAEMRFYVAGVVRSIIAHVADPEVRGRISADLHAIGAQMRDRTGGK